MTALFRALAAVAALLLATAILYAGNGLQGTLLSVRADLETFPTATIGILMSAYFAGFIAGCRIVPALILSVGHIRTFVALASIASSSALAHALLVDVTVWALLRAVTGFSFAGLAMVLESWINERATNANRGRVLSIYRSVDLAAVAFGNALLAVASPLGFQLFALVSILISLALVPVALTRSVAPAPLQSARLDLGRLYRVSPVGAVGAFSTGLANAAFWGMAPVFVLDQGFGAGLIAAFMTSAIVGAGLAQVPLGWLSDRVDRRAVIVASAALGAGAAVAIALFGARSESALLFFSGLFGAAVIPVFGLSAAHANDFSPPGEAVSTSGGLLLLHGLGAVGGATLGAVAMAALGAPALFAYIAAVYLGLCLFSLARMRIRAAVPSDDKMPFVPAPKSPTTIVYPQEDAGPPGGEPS